MPPSLKIPEAHAWQIANGIASLPPEDQRRAVGILAQYKQQQDEAGLPEWPSALRDQQEATTRFRSMFTGDLKDVDGPANLGDVMKFSTDPDQLRSRTANTVFLARKTGKPAEEVGAGGMYETLRQLYAQETWDHYDQIDDKTFHALASKEVQGEISVEQLDNEAQQDARLAALDGDSAIDALSNWQAQAMKKDGYKPALMGRYLESFSQTAKVLAPRRDMINGFVTELQKHMQGKPADSEGMEMFREDLLSMPPDQLQMVLGAMHAKAQAAGSKADKGSGLDVGGGIMPGSKAASGFVQEMGEGLARFVAPMGGMEAEQFYERAKTSGAVATAIPEIKTAADAKAFIEEQASFESALTTGAESGGVTPPGPDRKLSLAEAALAEAAKARSLKGISLARQIRSTANQTDPVGNVAGSLGASVPLMAGIMVGGFAAVPVLAKMYAESDYDQLRLEHPSIPTSQARAISTVAGLGEAALDMFEPKILGRMPTIAGLLRGGLKRELIAQAGANIGGSLVLETVQEFSQDAVLPALVSAFARDAPGVNVEEIWRDYARGRLDTFTAIVPLVFVFSGVATVRDFHGFRETIATNENLGRAGYPEADREHILELRQNGTDEQLQAALQEAAPRRSPEIAAEFGADEKQTGQIEASKALDAMMQRQGYRLERNENGWKVWTPDNKSVQVEKAADAIGLMSQHFSETELKNATAVAEMADAFLSQKRGGESITVEPGKARDIKDDVESGVTTPEKARESIITAGRLAGLTEEESMEQIGAVLGSSTIEENEGVREAVSRIYQGGNAMTVVEEAVEGRWKLGLAKGRYTPQQGETWVRLAEQATGETYLPADYSERDLVEAISHIVKADVLGRRKDGARLGAGLVTRGVQAAAQQGNKEAGKFGAFLSSFRALFGRIFGTARKLQAARKGGKLSADWESQLDDLLGLDPQARYENSVTKEAQALVSGETFSIGQSGGGPVNSGDERSGAEASQDPSRLDGERSFLVADASGGDRFHDSIVQAARANRFGFAVEVKEREFYSDPGNKLYLGFGDKAGAVLTLDRDLVSVFKHPDLKERIAPLLAEAAEHALTLDGFDIGGVLPGLYALFHFRPAARVAFNREFAPPNWNYELGGEPDVVFMVRDTTGASGLLAVPREGYAQIRDQVPLVSYDEAQKIQKAAADKAKAATSYSLAPRSLAARLQSEAEKRMGDPEFRSLVFREIKKRLGKAAEDFESIKGSSEGFGLRKTELETEHQAGFRAAEEAHQQFLEQLEADRELELGGAREDGQTKAEKDAIKAKFARAIAEEKARWKNEQSQAEGDHEVSMQKLEAAQKRTQTRDQLLAVSRTLDAMMSVMPIEVRGKAGGFTQVLKATTDEALFKVLAAKLERLDKGLEKFMRDDFRERIDELFNRSKPKGKSGEKPKGSLGADIHEMLVDVHAASKLGADEVDAKLAELDSLIDGNTLTPEQEALAMRQRSLIELAGDLKSANAARLSAAYEAIKNTIDGGYLAWQTKLIEQREKRTAAREALKRATGEKGTAAERDQQAKADAKILGKAASARLNLSSFAEVVKSAFGKAREAMMLIDRERKASNAYEDAVQDMGDTVEAFFTRLAGGDMMAGQRIRYDLAQPSVKAEGRELSQLQAIQALLMWQQEDGRRHMEGAFDEAGKPAGDWNYDQDFIDKLESQLSPEAKKVKAFLETLYAAEYEPLNALYKERHGVSLPHNPKYAPLTVKPQQAKAGQMVDPVSGAAVHGSILTPGSLRTRNQSAIAEPQFRDALATFIAHTKQMEHWKAYYDFAVDAQAILGNRELMNSVEVAAGGEAVTVLNKWIDAFAQGGARDAASGLAFTNLFSRAAGRAARIALVGRVSTLLVQSTQLAAASVRMPLHSYMWRFSKLMTGQLGWSDAMRSDFIQRRIQTMPPIVQEAMQDLGSATKPSVIRSAVRRLGDLLSGADGLFTAGTYAILLDYHRTNAAEMGLTGAAAEQWALRETERTTEEVAQPTRMANRSIMEVTNTHPFGRVLWAFSSESRQKLSLAAWALHQGLNRTGASGFVGKSASLLTDPGAYKTVGLAWLVGGLASQVLKNLWRDLKGDDDERKWSVGALTRATLAGPLGGIPGARLLIEPGSTFDAAQHSLGAAARIFTLNEEDYIHTMRDFETLLSTAGFFFELPADLASLAHLGIDGAKVLNSAFGN